MNRKWMMDFIIYQKNEHAYTLQERKNICDVFRHRLNAQDEEEEPMKFEELAKSQ